MCMAFVVIGTDHRMQYSEDGFEGLLRAWLSRKFIEPLGAIAEEYAEAIGNSVGQRLADEFGLRWFNLDMTSDEKLRAGILGDQRGRPIETETIAFRVRTDEVREEAWTRKLIESEAGTTLVICGYLHLESLVNKLREKGCAVDRRIYLDTVPEIKMI
jgi:hypothetical protein